MSYTNISSLRSVGKIDLGKLLKVLIAVLSALAGSIGVMSCIGASG